MDLHWVSDRQIRFHELETPKCFATFWDNRHCTHRIYRSSSPHHSGMVPPPCPYWQNYTATCPVVWLKNSVCWSLKCFKPQTKRTQKTHKSKQTIRKSAQKTHNGKQFAFSVLLSWTWTWFNKNMFWWAYQPKLLMHDQTVRLGLKLHVTLQQSFLPVWHYDITCLAQVQWYNDMVWKNLFNFVSERSVWAGNVQNGPNVQQSKRRRIIELLKVQVFCIQVFRWILLEG